MYTSFGVYENLTTILAKMDILAEPTLARRRQKEGRKGAKERK